MLDRHGRTIAAEGILDNSIDVFCTRNFSIMLCLAPPRRLAMLPRMKCSMRRHMLDTGLKLCIYYDRLKRSSSPHPKICVHRARSTFLFLVFSLNVSFLDMPLAHILKPFSNML
ncbi:hypothetical protein K450DRAFT_227478 [Umbelopsis ramanniana AG]|uniref:Uncharacterized protein n=1 Tax=Umbelopsis ramanniana AG TaxID=1314678 RepID=A0AAD5EHR2_UMBRA|nr:uncharacterized protein K450DRAFT_227478 [Umbelopsis ramanniana AG]KAI8582505.1 hypothetical protein K450DRAFT_227478 [Umbelopsis ramanniana AG]